MTKLISLERFKELTSDKTGELDLDVPVGVNKFFTPELKQINQETREIDFIISSGAIDRDYDTINPRGWDLTNYKKSPVVLFAHNSREPPVGRATMVKRDGDNLIARAKFATFEEYPFAETIYRLVIGQFLKATSVGFIPKEWSYVEDNDRPYGIDFLKQELLEFSIVPVPANPEALIQARSKGIDLDPLFEHPNIKGAAPKKQPDKLYPIKWSIRDDDTYEGTITDEGLPDETGDGEATPEPEHAAEDAPAEDVADTAPEDTPETATTEELEPAPEETTPEDTPEPTEEGDTPVAQDTPEPGEDAPAVEEPPQELSVNDHLKAIRGKLEEAEDVDKDLLSALDQLEATVAASNDASKDLRELIGKAVAERIGAGQLDDAFKSRYNLDPQAIESKEENDNPPAPEDGGGDAALPSGKTIVKLRPKQEPKTYRLDTSKLAQSIGESVHKAVNAKVSKG